MRKILYDVLERDISGGRWSIIVNWALVFLILLSAGMAILSSRAMLDERFGGLFSTVEFICLAVFSLEYVLRIWCAVEGPAAAEKSHGLARLNYALTPMALIDLIAILPFYIHFLFPIDLLFLRLFRLLRLLKLVHHFQSLQIFTHVVRREAGSLLAVLLLTMILLVVVASLMFLFEGERQPEAFGDIGSSLWWAVVTLTTVGYGDVTPMTQAGKILAGMTMLLGIGIVALPAGLLAARYGDELRNRSSQLRRDVSVAFEDGVLSATERTFLLERSKELGIDGTTLEAIVHEFQEGLSRDGVCPCCGHRHGPGNGELPR